MINFRAIDFWKPWRSMGSSVHLGTLRWQPRKSKAFRGNDSMSWMQFYSLDLDQATTIFHWPWLNHAWSIIIPTLKWNDAFFMMKIDEPDQLISSIWDGLGGPRMFYLAHLMDKCAKLSGTPRNYSALNLNWVLDAFEIQPYLPQVTGTLFWETFACTTTIKKPGTNCIKNFQDQNNIDLWWSYRGPFFVVPRATVFLSTSSWSLY